MNDLKKDIENNSLSIQDFWELNHQQKIENYKFWLTGSLGPEVWRYLSIEDRILPGKIVLNIGVGLGHCTKALAKRGCIVHALDISENALEKVRDVVTHTWLPSSLQEIPAEHF
jgi:2-polyprenyl-3-methyl-5-hydroxy-6-metoxy-1,4-benzoquinol methylase